MTKHTEFPNRLAVWPNKKRQKQTDPHLRGEGVAATNKGSEPVWVSAWFSKDLTDEDKRALQDILSRYTSNRPIINLALTPKSPEQREPVEVPPDKKPEFEDDDIPF